MKCEANVGEGLKTSSCHPSVWLSSRENQAQILGHTRDIVWNSDRKQTLDVSELFWKCYEKDTRKSFLQHHHRRLFVTFTFTILANQKQKNGWPLIVCDNFPKNPGWKNVFQAALFSRCHWEKYRSRVCIFIIIWSWCLRSIWPQAGHKRKLEASANSGNVLRSPLSEHQCNHYHNWKDRGAYFLPFWTSYGTALTMGNIIVKSNFRSSVSIFQFCVLRFFGRVR